MTGEAFLFDGVRTPIGRYGGALSGVRTDDLAAAPIRALLARNASLDPGAIEDVYLGCANQAGEDNRNVARMAALLAGLPQEVPGMTLNRLCASGLEAVVAAARAVRVGEAELCVAGGVESMSRAPFVMPKSPSAFSRNAEIYDTTIGWRFVNAAIEKQYGVDSMGGTAENVAVEYAVSREDQDAFALASQRKTQAAIAAGRLGEEIAGVEVPQRKAPPKLVSQDEHPRTDITLEALAALKPAFKAGGSVTAGNASGVNDGAAALFVGSEAFGARYSLTPRARVVAAAAAGVAPRLMGMGPVPATAKAFATVGLSIEHMDVIELNEAFAAQALACTRQWGLADDDPRVNADGGAIALGHPLGMTGARLVLTAVRRLHAEQGRYALCTMCVGVGQGAALVLERI